MFVIPFSVMRKPDCFKDDHGKAAFKISCTKGEERLSHTKIIKSPYKDLHEPASQMACLGFGSTARLNISFSIPRLPIQSRRNEI